jgi:hypothetical protein
MPTYHGSMNLGDGVTAILSVSTNAPHQAVHAGETIGAFKLVEITGTDLALEWDGHVIRKKLYELTDHSGGNDNNTPPRSAPPAPAAAPAVQQVAKTPTGPGADTGRGFKACDPGDSTAEGAVVDGFRKVVTQTPFGNSCRWDPVSR